MITLRYVSWLYQLGVTDPNATNISRHLIVIINCSVMSQASATSASSRFGSINLLHHLLLEVMGVEDDAIVIITTDYNREEMDSLLVDLEMELKPQAQP
ncbi:hypothetical protein L1987_06217 [Smallanthus sonchifolius]|uniref:Uncharacterized protein n=1 Tax=Smallanthus sonchifolius TaxID=185202 RepID=A0ACB9JXH0_9ASTR|nr:hypothetical protein L1987_06217 [Smallanthus sonchifolius]